MKIRQKRRTIWSLLLAAAIFIGSLPLTQITVKAAAGQGAPAARSGAAEKKASGSRFQHPGLMHSQESLDPAGENVQNNVSPNKETWDELLLPCPVKTAWNLFPSAQKGSRTGISCPWSVTALK